MLIISYIFLLGIATGEDVRFDCHPEPDASKEVCEGRHCIWKEDKTMVGLPYCYMQPKIGYKLLSKTSDVRTLTKSGEFENPWDKDIKEIYFASKYIGKTLNVKIYVPGRYEPPLDLPNSPSESNEELKLTTYDDDDPFYFTVSRKSTQTKLWDTSLGGLIFCNQFIQIATKLPTEEMYGWGENVHTTLKHRFDRYTTWAMFARDEWPSSEGLSTKNLYGVHPFYMMLEKDGKAHGVFILNSNAQEIVTAPGPSLIYRTIGGNLDMYFFPGPTPEEVTQQYLDLIGKPSLPAYWGLGFQISRWGYKNFADLRNVVERNIQAGVPFDTVVGDIDYMDRRKDFTIGKDWEEFPAYADQLHNRGMRLVLMFDPAVQANYEPFERAMTAGAKFVEWERPDQVMTSINRLYPMVNGTKIMLGLVWPDNHTAFPDFLDPSGNTEKWWIDELVRFKQEIDYDGIWIDMNEPANFETNGNEWWSLQCPTEEGTEDARWDMPPYKTHNVWVFGKRVAQQVMDTNLRTVFQDASSGILLIAKTTGAYLATKTLCMSAVQANGALRHYDVKNLYGWSESKITQKGQYQAVGKRGIVISRSTFASSGRYCGHWLGDNSATWDDLRSAVIGAQEFNLFGIPYIGSDICGFNRPSEEELCLRWHQMGAFHTFMRNHNHLEMPPQDPANWTSVAEATRKATLFRYSYLPYLFSLHFEASMKGGTVIRPVFYEFPTDRKTHDLSYQFLWGSSMLIAPVVHQGVTSVKAYLPKDDWYSVFDYHYGQRVWEGEQIFPAPWDSLIPVFIRGGAIIPCQEPNITTDYTRNNAFKLVIAPSTRTSRFPADSAYGFLYWDDGESIVESFETYSYYHWTFNYKQSELEASLTIEMKHEANHLQIPTLDTLEIFNYKYPIDLKKQRFTLNGNEVEIDREASKFDLENRTLNITKEKFIDLSAWKTIELTWKNKDASNASPMIDTQLWLLFSMSLMLFQLL